MVSVLCGVGLIAIALLDVTLTALHVQTESPFSTRLHRAVWAVLTRTSRDLPERAREEILGLALPAMLGATMVSWAIVYIIGFALLYAPSMHDPFNFAVADPRSAFEDALFYSGTTFFTLGSSEIRAVGTGIRALVVMEGGIGLLTISMAVTYLLNVYPILSQKAAVAERLNQLTVGRADGVLTATRFLALDHPEPLLQRLDALNAEVLHLAHAHRLYPVLYYVRSSEAHESFVRILALTQGLVGTLRYALDGERYRELVSDPRLLMLEEGLLDTLHLLARSSHLSVSPVGGQEPATGGIDDVASELAREGLQPARLDAQSRREYERFRHATEPYIRAYAHNISYPADVVWRTYDRRARDSEIREPREAGTRAA